MTEILDVLKYIFPCAVAIAMILVGVYWACRAIDYRFRSRENQADYRHEMNMLGMASTNEDYRQRKLQERGYELNKQLIQSATDRVKWLSQDVVATINKGRVEAAKSLMGDVVNMTKDMMKEMQEML